MKGSRMTALKTIFILPSKCGRCEDSDELWTCMADAGIIQPCSGGSIPGDRG